jgi:hypothetical protein
MATETQVIEINGVKLEVDMRYAKRVDLLRIGSRVKVLVKTYSEYKIYPGVVVGFDPFQNLPSITVAYIDVNYNEAALKFVAINGSTKDTEIVLAVDADHLGLDRDEILKKMGRQISTKQLELEQLEQTREFFLKKFGAYFTDFVEPAAEPQPQGYVNQD